MNDSELNKTVQRKLHEYETLAVIKPTEEWSRTMNERIKSVKPYSSSFLHSAGLSIAVLLITLINIGFVLAAIIHKSAETTDRKSDFETIYRELLINTNSSNN